ncbi:MAG: hypothetical protein PHY54_16995 [Methylococcales bacterium]|nr:hypothetical protein [Methylococcales bacterium]
MEKILNAVKKKNVSSREIAKGNGAAPPQNQKHDLRSQIKSD